MFITWRRQQGWIILQLQSLSAAWEKREIQIFGIVQSNFLLELSISQVFCFSSICPFFQLMWLWDPLNTKIRNVLKCANQMEDNHVCLFPFRLSSLPFICIDPSFQRICKLKTKARLFSCKSWVLLFGSPLFFFQLNFCIFVSSTQEFWKEAMLLPTWQYISQTEFFLRNQSLTLLS